MPALEPALVERGHAWEQDALASGTVPEIIGAVDETFLARLLLVFVDRPPGISCGKPRWTIAAMLHLVHAIVNRYALAMGRQWGQARQEWQQAQDGFQRHQERAPRYPAAHAKGQRWEVGQREYRQWLATLALTLHPLRIADSAPQTSTQVESGVHAQVEAMEALAPTAQLSDRQAAMKKVQKGIHLKRDSAMASTT